jgi:hypothetical protein
MAVDGLGDGGDGMGEKDGVWWEGRREALGEGLCTLECEVSSGDKDI